MSKIMTRCYLNGVPQRIVLPAAYSRPAPEITHLLVPPSPNNHVTAAPTYERKNRRDTWCEYPAQTDSRHVGGAYPFHNFKADHLYPFDPAIATASSEGLGPFDPGGILTKVNGKTSR